MTTFPRLIDESAATFVADGALEIDLSSRNYHRATRSRDPPPEFGDRHSQSRVFQTNVPPGVQDSIGTSTSASTTGSACASTSTY
jgi:hypothetical protein